ncbi:MYXO-CTERM sorting domain-containing protein [Nannocystis pusilla]|uniref:MYXO-CTERM sorting domain-containing protein n=1 Tax=Nannocystis pusilla TaxID=889268 RepID=UPI003BF36498
MGRRRKARQEEPGHRADPRRPEPAVRRRWRGRLQPLVPAARPGLARFGTALAGETAQLRFRVGTNPSTGGHGWDLDDFEFAGIVDGPFPQWIDDDGECDGESPTTTEDGMGTGTGDDSSAAGASDTSDEQPSGENGCACSAAGEGGPAALQFAPLLLLAALRRRAR